MGAKFRSLARPSNKEIPILLKVFGVVLIMLCVMLVPVFVLVAIDLPQVVSRASERYGVATLALCMVEIALLIIACVTGVALGVNLLRDRRRNARRIIEFLVIVEVLIFLCDTMVRGLRPLDLLFVVRFTVLAALMSYIDPSLSEERELRRKLRDMEVRDRMEEGTLGRDESGKGYIELDFFNLFWVFVVCSVLGLLIELVFHMVFVDPGVYQDRAGMLFGPFSPIYGVGAVFMTIALNRLYDNNIFFVFIASAAIGGAFEYFVSWFLRFSFGIVAWDYTGSFLSIDGRTNAMYMFFWGVLGCVWVKLLLPWLLKLVNMIPWNWRYSVTAVCAALMFCNAAMTLMAFDCWYQREAGLPPENAVEEYYADRFDNEYMANRFQSMSIDPSNTSRIN